ncbi:MAG: hypothetical protein COA58_13495 [Bacteroidetes bacterium]|nr:MAG: hypothetical protein COA58_13495 [Bacteroidota bacterium]
MNVINKLFVFLFSITLLTNLSSCKDDEVEPKPQIIQALELNCETVPEDSTLTLVDLGLEVDYVLNCIGKVRGDLIIEPGVTVQFGTDAGIKVSETGSIQVLGTAQDPVVFTGEDLIPGSWKGIFIDSKDVKNKIEYATVEYAGGGYFNSNGDLGGVIVYSNTLLNMNNTTISHSKAYGFNASYGGDELVLKDNTITNCNVPMLVLPNYVDGMDGGTYTGNKTDAIYVANGFTTIDATWRNLGVPYHILARLVVSAGGGKLTINPGVVMEFGLNGSLEVAEGASGSKPSLIAVGTAQNPILFTGIDKVEGAWKGIWFDTPSALNEIGFVTIEYASNSDQSGAIYMWYGTILNVHDVLFKDIKECAIHQYVSSAGDSSNLTTSNLSFENVGSTTICQN